MFVIKSVIFNDTVMSNPMFRKYLFFHFTTSSPFRKQFSSSPSLIKPGSSDNERNQVGHHNIWNIFFQYGVPSEVVSKIINDCGELNSKSEMELDSTLRTLANFQFGEEQLINLLQTHPKILLVPNSKLLKTYIFFSGLFTPDYVYKVFLNSPHIILEKKTNIEEKLQYLKEELNASNSDIIHSGALNFELRKIKLRHEFLKRLGILKEIKDDTKINLRLDYILNTSDNDFATKVAKVTLFEYEVFEEMFNNANNTD